MTDSKLTKFPKSSDLLTDAVGRENDLAWWLPFDAAVVREYIAAWFEWYIENRRKPEFVSEEMLNYAYENYTRILGQNMPWFRNALHMVQVSDPNVEKPILVLYFAAKTEALASLDIFQSLFQEGLVFNPEPAVRNFINAKIEAAESLNPAQPYLFGAVANAYEHTFSFLMRMLGEYCEQYGKMPELEEYDQLANQLLLKLRQETRLSRRENALLEDHFRDSYNFFSFSMKEGRFQLDINYPTAEERAVLIRKQELLMGQDERGTQQLKAALPIHYGCPAAFAHHNGITPIGFVVRGVLSAFRTAVWPPEGLDIRPMVAFERNHRRLITSEL